MNVGLLCVPVSVYQMLRGALVLWVGLFSVLFLHRRLPKEQWISLFIVMLGVAIVGLSNSISKRDQDPDEAVVNVGKAIIGALLILFAQLFTASQFVIEEKIMMKYSLEPLVSPPSHISYPITLNHYALLLCRQLSVLKASLAQ